MRAKLSGTLWRLAIFVTICSLGAFALVTIFAQLRFDDVRTYNAAFTTVAGLETGNFVRIAGVEVGKVEDITVRDDSTALVEFSANDTVVLTEGSKAVIRYDNLIGGRYLALEEGAGATRKLPRAPPSRWTAPLRHWTSTRSLEASGRCSGHWTPIR